jgi:hypothetical protein
VRMPRAAASVLIVALMFLAVPARVRAHTGFEHFVGAITVVNDETVELKTDKTDVVFKLTPDTRYLRRGRPVAHRDLVVGARVVIDARREKGTLIAKEVRFVVEAD